jgi:hypothetical protein
MNRTLNAFLFAGTFVLCVNQAHADTFTTAAAGNWTSGSTWVGGVAPATDVDGDDIVIGHDVVVVNNDIKLMNGATLSASSAGFTMSNGNFTVEDGSADFLGCNVYIEHGFNFQLTTSAASLTMIDCEVDIGQNFQNSEGFRYLENVCLIVDENFQNAKGDDTLINVCAIIGNDISGNFQNDSDSTMHIVDSEFHLPNGDFQNQSSASLSGNITAVWLENGNLQNDGTWTADVAHYCVSAQVTVNSTYLPAAEDCVGTPTFFEPCDCSGITDCNDNGVDDALDIAGGMADLDQNGVPDECEPGHEVYCVPDGTDVGLADCPCSNDVQPGASQGCINSTGMGATLVATGIPSFANDTMVLTATNFPVGSPGIFFAGTQSVNAPFSNGLRCVGGSTQRLDKIAFGNDGTGMMPAPGFPELHNLHNVNPGDTMHYQFWYRDPGGPCGGSSNLSNGVRVTWGI